MLLACTQGNAVLLIHKVSIILAISGRSYNLITIALLPPAIPHTCPALATRLLNFFQTFIAPSVCCLRIKS